MLTGEEFERAPEGARSAASRGPVFITERGRVAYVVLTIEDYCGLTAAHMSLGEALAQPGADFDFDPVRIGIVLNPADLD